MTSMRCVSTLEDEESTAATVTRPWSTHRTYRAGRAATGVPPAEGTVRPLRPGMASLLRRAARQQRKSAGSAPYWSVRRRARRPREGAMGDSWVGIVAIAAGIGVAVAALVHRRYRRRRESALLRSVLDALMREDELAGLTIMARARVSFGARSPAMVLIAGPAMGPETRATALAWPGRRQLRKTPSSRTESCWTGAVRPPAERAASQGPETRRGVPGDAMSHEQRAGRPPVTCRRSSPGLGRAPHARGRRRRGHRPGFRASQCRGCDTLTSV
jgi:hypothetical protein